MSPLGRRLAALGPESRGDSAARRRPHRRARDRHRRYRGPGRHQCRAGILCVRCAISSRRLRSKSPARLTNGEIHLGLALWDGDGLPGGDSLNQFRQPIGNGWDAIDVKYPLAGCLVGTALAESLLALTIVDSDEMPSAFWCSIRSTTKTNAPLSLHRGTRRRRPVLHHRRRIAVGFRRRPPVSVVHAIGSHSRQGARPS